MTWGKPKNHVWASHRDICLACGLTAKNIVDLGLVSCGDVSIHDRERLEAPLLPGFDALDPPASPDHGP